MNNLTSHDMFNPFKFNGMDVIVAPKNIPVIQLSPAIMAILDPAFAAETNAWLIERFGYKSMLPDGVAYMFNGQIMMNPTSVVKLAGLCT